MPRSILITGGAGYIGTHIISLLQDPADTIVVLDDFSNSYLEALHGAEKLAGRKLDHIAEGDLAGSDALHLLNMLFHRFSFTCVIHCAGKKNIAECFDNPLNYYHTNVTSTINIVRAMSEHNCKRFIFSSSATVYAPQDNGQPYTENCPILASNPYGRTKVMCEEILRDVSAADKEWSILSLRYFNPVGAHTSVQIGENPRHKSASLMSMICEVANGNLQELDVYGGDYLSKNGTAVRDFIHIMDLARGHVDALCFLDDMPSGFEIINLGTGRGINILEVVQQMEQICHKPIPFKITARREGDLGVVYSQVEKANRILKWRAKHNLEDMCKNAWHWSQVLNLKK